MKTLPLALAVVACLFVFTATAAPEADAIAQYSAYVAAVRAGQVQDAVKLIEPISESCKSMLTAFVTQAIAVEAMKKEMLAQLGPPKVGEEGWEIGGLPYDDVLKNLKGVAWDENMVALRATDPRSNVEGTVGWMVRHDGKWMVPAGLVMDLQPAAQFVEPEAAEREQKIKYAESITKAAKAVLKRLRNKEFKKPADVPAALGEEMKKAAGQ